MAMISINGTSIITPKSFSVNIMDLDATAERNAAGDLLRDRIAVKRKLELEWGPMSPSEISTLLNAVSAVFFDVTYPDPMTGGNVTKNMYVGDRTAPLFKTGMWDSLKMSFIER